ncbi:MAG TPA: hypothetical protein VGB25_10300 [Candidatus Binatia bacterium]
MSLAEKVERLARIVPGVAGYQDKEKSRESDKNIRLHLSAELDGLKRELEGDKRRIMNGKDLSLLPALDSLTAKLDKLSNTVKYASRGYRAVFDEHKVDLVKLDALCNFDLRLVDEVGTLKAQAARLRDAHGRGAVQQQVMETLADALDEFERTFATRQNIIAAG